MLFIIAVFLLIALTLLLPSLIITRLLFHVRRRKGPVMRFLSYPIGPPIPGRGADRGALQHALKRWALLGLKTFPLLLVRLVLHGPGNPTDSLTLGDTSDPSHNRVIAAIGARPPLSRAAI